MSKRTNTDPMGFAARRSPKTEPMLVAPLPPSPTPTGDLTATSEATTEESAGVSPAAPVLSKAEIRSIFQDLSDGLGDPTTRADAPESEVAQYAEPRPLRAKNKTPALEPAIVLRKSVVDEVLPLQAMPGARPKERRARVGTDTVRAQRLVTRTRARIGVAVTVVALALAAALLLQKREPEKVSDSKRTLAPNPSPPKEERRVENAAPSSVPSAVAAAPAPARSQEEPKKMPASIASAPESRASTTTTRVSPSPRRSPSPPPTPPPTRPEDPYRMRTLE